MHRRALLPAISRPRDPLRSAVVLHVEPEGPTGTVTFRDLSKYAAPETVAGSIVVSLVADSNGELRGRLYVPSFNSINRLSYASAPQYSVASGDFSIEWDYEPDRALNVNDWVASVQFHRDDTTIRTFFHYSNTWYVQGNGAGYLTVPYTLVPNVNMRYHVGRNGTTFYLHIGGVLQTVTLVSGGPSFPDVAQPFKIGADATNGANAQGKFGRFRFTNGACRYTENYTPQQLPWARR